ncbi:SRPBCC family protein [Chryseobacterium sp. A301]
MRWIRFAFIFAALILLGYGLSLLFEKGSTQYTIEKNVDYPLEKVFPMFRDLKQFARWNVLVKGSESSQIHFFRPYEGKGASLHYFDPKNNHTMEMFLRYENPNSTLRYQLFEGTESLPYLIDLKFKELGPNQTKIRWSVKTPSRSVFKSSLSRWNEEEFRKIVDQSVLTLSSVLSNRVDRDQLLSKITYDSLMVEEQQGALLVGVNVSTSNHGDALFKNIVLNHNKVFNYITTDLGKDEEEFGFPILVSQAQNTKSSEVSYFYGFPVSKRSALSDNSFSFKTLNAAKTYVLYYKGPFEKRQRAVAKLVAKAKADSLRYGELSQRFFQAPKENAEVNLKLSLPVFR